MRVSRDEHLGKTLTLLRYENRHYDEPLEAEVPIGDAERVYLKLVFKAETFHFEYALTDKNWSKIGPDFEAGKLSDDFCQGMSFTGTFIALCAQDLSGARLHADFDYFSYRETRPGA